MTACNPLGVSRMDTFRLSPEFMNRSFCGSGGASVLPFLLRNAKLTYSRPVLAAQVGFSVVPVTGFSARLKMFMAAHHLVGSHALAPTATCHVGQGTQPGG